MDTNKRMGPLFIGGIVCVLIIVLMVVIGNVMIIGEKIGHVSVWLSYLFYIVAAICFAWIIVLPVLRVLLTPTFNGIGDADLKDLTPSQTTEYIENLKKSIRLTKEEAWELHANPDRKAAIDSILNDRYGQMKAVVKNAAVANFIITGVSQNGGLDFIASMRINFKMISDIVALLGKRPSFGQLFKLYVSVLSASLLITTLDDMLENLEFDEMVGELGIAGGQLLNVVIPSAANGLMNAFVTLRVGHTTIKYLEMGSKNFNGSLARKHAIKAARKELLGVGKDGVVKLAGRVKTSITNELL